MRPRSNAFDISQKVARTPFTSFERKEDGTFSSVGSGGCWVYMVDCLLKYVFRRSAFSSSDFALVVSSIRVGIGSAFCFGVSCLASLNHALVVILSELIFLLIYTRYPFTFFELFLLFHCDNF